MVKTAESKPPEKTAGVDSKDGLTPEEIIKMNIEKMKKKNPSKSQKASVSRSVDLANFVECLIIIIVVSSVTGLLRNIKLSA